MHMTNVLKFFLTTYLIILTMFVSFNCTMMIYFMMELNLFSFISVFFFNMKSKKLVKQKCLYYFIIQSIMSLIILFTFINELEMKIISESLFILVLMVLISFKLGMIPFTWWMLKLCNFTNSINFSMILILQKIPLMILWINFLNNSSMMVLVLNLIISPFLMFKSVNMEMLMIFSSLFNLLWIILFMAASFINFLLYMLTYMISSWILMYSLNFINFNLLSYLIILGFFLSIPPFMSFFMKIYTMMNFEVFSSLLIFLVSLFNVIMLTSYYKFFYSVMMNIGVVYNYNYYMKINMMLVYICSIYIIFC